MKTNKIIVLLSLAAALTISGCAKKNNNEEFKRRILDSDVTSIILEVAKNYPSFTKANFSISYSSMNSLFDPEESDVLEIFDATITRYLNNIISGSGVYQQKTIFGDVTLSETNKYTETIWIDTPLKDEDADAGFAEIFSKYTIETVEYSETSSYSLGLIEPERSEETIDEMMLDFAEDVSQCSGLSYYMDMFDSSMFILEDENTITATYAVSGFEKTISNPYYPSDYAKSLNVYHNNNYAFYLKKLPKIGWTCVNTLFEYQQFLMTDFNLQRIDEPNIIYTSTIEAFYEYNEKTNLPKYEEDLVYGTKYGYADADYYEPLLFGYDRSTFEVLFYDDCFTNITKIYNNARGTNELAVFLANVEMNDADHFYYGLVNGVSYVEDNVTEQYGYKDIEFDDCADNFEEVPGHNMVAFKNNGMSNNLVAFITYIVHQDKTVSIKLSMKIQGGLH